MFVMQQKHQDLCLLCENLILILKVFTLSVDAVIGQLQHRCSVFQQNALLNITVSCPIFDTSF